MAEKLEMTALSPTMESGKISAWLIKEGESFEEGDAICEIETDKTTMDYEVENNGTLLKIIKNSGECANVGECIAIIGEANEDISEITKTLNIQGSNTNNLIQEEKIEVPPNTTSNNKENLNKIKDEIISTSNNLNNKSRIFISPLAKVIANQNSIDIKSANISGTGPIGRIVKQDILDYIENNNTNIKPVIQQSTTINKNIKKPVIPNIDLNASINNLNYTTIEVSNKRKIIGERLTYSKNTIPHYYLSKKLIVDNLISMRNDLNQKRLDYGQDKLGLNAFIIKFIASAIKKNPYLNASYISNPDNDKIILYKNIDISIAVAQEDGLITPIIKSCENKGIIEIDTSLKSLVKKASQNKLKLEEFQGGTFTISNLGSFGIDNFNAIINPPQSAIIAIGKLDKELYIDKNNNYNTRNIMNVTLSCDHRVIDGKDAALFLKDLQDFISDPMKILF